MSKLNRVLNNKERAIKEEASVKKQKKGKKRVIPVYDTKGRTITPEKKAREKKIYITVIAVAAALAFVYVPGMFMSPSESAGPIAQPDSEAIKINNAVIRRYTEDDFDGDGFTNAAEETYETNLWNPDTDNDGAYDAYEINVSKTDPNVYDEDILIDLQTKADERKEKNMGSPYSIGNVTMWASDYHSKAHGSVIETPKGYRFSEFNGYASFPAEKGRYAYKIENGVRTLLPYREQENAWRIMPWTTVEMYQQKLEEIVELKLVAKTMYLHESRLTDILATILPDNGFITAQKKMRIDVEPDTSQDVITEIIKPTYDSTEDYRFTRNTNTLQELQTIRKAIAEDGSCVAVSLYNANYGEYIAIIYGYTAEGDLLIADANTLEPVGEIKITELAKKIVDQNGQILSMGYFEFDGMGFHSSNGDRICFFQVSNGQSNLAMITESAQAAAEEAPEVIDADEAIKALQEQGVSGAETEESQATSTSLTSATSETDKTVADIDASIQKEQQQEAELQQEIQEGEATTAKPEPTASVSAES